MSTTTRAATTRRDLSDDARATLEALGIRVVSDDPDNACPSGYVELGDEHAGHYGVSYPIEAVEAACNVASSPALDDDPLDVRFEIFHDALSGAHNDDTRAAERARLREAVAVILDGGVVRVMCADAEWAHMIVAGVERMGGRVFAEHAGRDMYTLTLDDDPTTERN